ncbi:hypothetical protein XELAEV_18043142mg [Xenopus laevis]|uniref:Uncharacterized protein n=1 Tax=Xenopus laevis TaxID=8355 RepID=A0A974H251_XENLA|nr:hypothetical protein XELAEV_18043142mg [Xenopus laevis]
MFSQLLKGLIHCMDRQGVELGSKIHSMCLDRLMCLLILPALGIYMNMPMYVIGKSDLSPLVHSMWQYQVSAVGGSITLHSGIAAAHILEEGAALSRVLIRVPRQKSHIVAPSICHSWGT